MIRMIDTRCVLLGILALIAVLAQRQDQRRATDPIETGSIAGLVRHQHDRFMPCSCPGPVERN